MMDFNSMKRKDLQALCKQHNIPANSANSILIEKLSELSNEPEQEKPITRRRTCMKSPVETADEVEPRQAKKVRFSPTNDLVEYQLRSGRKQTPMAKKSKARRKSVAMKVDKSVDNDSIDDDVQAPSRRAVKGTNVDKEPKGRVTRSHVYTLANDNGVQRDESKQSKKPVKDAKKTSEPVEETVVGRVRATRSKAHTSVDDDATRPDVNPQVKKKRGKQVAQDIQNVEPSNELVDIPARVTRARGQTSEDTNNVVSNPKPEKKRTRKEMKATDQSNVAPEDKQEFPKKKSLRSRGTEEIDEDQGDRAEVVNVGRATRSKAHLAVKATGRNSKTKAANKNVVQQLEEPLKNAGGKPVKRRDVAAEDKEELPKGKSLRTQGVENLEENEGDKVEVVNGGRATRSKAHLAVKATGRNGKTKAGNKVVVQQLEEPLKRAGKKKVNRKKSVMPPVNSKVVLHSDKPVNRPTRNTRGETAVQKAQEKVISKAEIIGSPTAGKKQSKGKSAKVASDDEMKAANASGSPKSRKRRGTPVVEDQTIGTEYVSPVDESARRSTRSASKSEGKSVANKQLESTVKTPNSKLRNQPALKGDSSNKRAKLSVPKQSGSEYHAVKSTEKGTPVSKLVNLESGKESIETDLTPAVDGSRRRLTRSAIISDKNEVGSIVGKINGREPTETTNKKQRNEDVQLSSGKPGKFRPNPAVNTAPVRVARSGVKHRGNSSSNYSENLDKKKPARSVLKIQPLGDAQISSPKVAEVGPSSDVDSILAQPEVPPTATDGILGSLGDLQRPFSLEVTETSPDGISKGPCVQNNVKSTFREVEVQVAVNSEKSVPNETESTEPRSVSKGLQTEVMVEESVVSIGKTVTIEEDNVDVFLGDADKKADYSSNIDSSSVYLESFEQSNVKGKLEEDEGHVEPSSMAGFDGGNEVADNGGSDDVEDGTDAVHVSLAEQNDLSIAGKLEEDEGHVEQATIEGVDGGNDVAENCESDGVEDDLDAAHDSLAEQSAGENIIPDLPIDRCDVADVVVDAGNELAKELEADVVPSTRNDVHMSPIVSKSDDEHDSPILGIYDDEDGSVDATKGCETDERVDTNKDHTLQDPVLSDGDDEGVSTNNEHESNSKRLTDNDASDTSLLGQDNSFNMIKQPEPTLEPSSANDVVETPYSDNDISVADQEYQLKPQTGNDMSDICLIGEHDVEGGTVDVPKELETGLEPSNAYNTLEVHVSGDDVERENTVDDKSDGQDGYYEYEQLTSNDNPATDEQNVGDDDLEPDHTENMPAVTEDIITSSDREPEPESNIAIDNEASHNAGVCDAVRPSDTSTSIEASPAPATSLNDVASVRVDALEIETGLEPSNDKSDGKSEHEQFTSNASPSTDERYVRGDNLEPDHTENRHAVTEVLITSSDQEPEPESNISIDKVTVGVCDSVRPSDSSTRIEELSTPAKSGKDVASVTVDESLNINENAICNIFGDNDELGNTIEVTDTKNDSGNEQIVIETSELNEGIWSRESASVSPHMGNELITEETKTTTENDHTLTSDYGLDGGKVMEDCSNLGVDELDSQHENLISEERPSIVYSKDSTPSTYDKEEFSNSPASAKEGDNNKHGPNTPADLENSSFELDEQNPLLADKSDIMDESVKDDRVSDVATSGRGSSFIEESSNSAAGFIDSVKNVDKASRNVTDGNSNQELDMMKENSKPDITNEIFNWSESSLKSLFTAPPASPSIHVKDTQEDVVNFVNQDHYSSLKSLFATPRTTITSHVKGGQEEAVSLTNQNRSTTISRLGGQEDAINLADQNNYSSTKSLSTTSATTTISRVKGGKADTTSHVQGSEADTTGFAFSDNRCNEDIGINQSAAPEFSHQWENEPLEVFNGETRGNATNSPKNEMHGVLSIEDYATTLFEDEEADGSIDGSGKNKNCEFNDDPYDLFGEAAGTSHHEASDTKDNMINSGMFEKKEETQLKWTKDVDDLASD